MKYRVLGPLQVDAAVDHPALRRRKPRALLALLLLRANEVVSTDALVDGLWGESAPPQALGSLQNYVSQLRKALGESVLVTRPPGYVLLVGPEELDLALFERVVGEASTKDPPERAERLRSALALWRGPALADFVFEPFAHTEAMRLEELRLSALESRVEADLVLGRHGELVGELEALVAEHPLRERMRGQLMLALFRAGRQADALAAYRDGRRLLREELGLEPGEELRRLERAILAHDPEVDAPVAPASAAPAPLETVRKVVTVLFADITGHTRLTTSLDPEALRSVMSRFFAAMSTVIERHGGTVEKFSGDEVMAVFGVPALHEDDALRAVRAAAEMRDVLAQLSDELETSYGVRLATRTGINTGEVVAGSPAEGALVTGEAVNVGKRLQESAAPGDVILGPVTLSLVRNAIEVEPVGQLELRGRPEPLSAFRLVAITEGAPGIARRHDAPLVGRDGEVERLGAAYACVRDESTSVLALIVGDAGIGKTRLSRELTASVAAEAQILVGRCVSYGEGATYLPIADVVRQATRDSSLEELLAEVDEKEAVVRGVRRLIAPGEIGPPGGEASWAVWRFLETLARRRPLVLVLEDLHWAEPTLLDLVEYLAEKNADVPLLVLADGRPELLERRPHWTRADATHVVIELEPLAEDESRTLVANLAPSVGLDSGLTQRIGDAAEGNPFFAEQLLAFVLERGADDVESLPPSIEALLASRLDNLLPLERAIVERASVVGRDFRQSELLALSPPEDAGVVAETLRTLERRGFVRPRRATASASDAFAFRHVLIRDAAYASVPKARRAELHERLGDWLSARADARDEIVGYHLEQAHRYLVDLAPATRHARQLAAEAGERLGLAGMRAFQGGDIPAAVNLLTRATSLLPEGERRLELTIELGLARWVGGDTAASEAILTDGIEAAKRAHNRRLELRGGVELASVHLFGGRQSELADTTMSAIQTFEAVNDDRALGRAWLLIGSVRGGFECQNAAWEEAIERALAHYRRAGWPTTTCVGELSAALFYGPRPVDDALQRAARLLEEDAGRVGSANVLVWIGGLEALRGNFDPARRLVERARGTYDDLGLHIAAASGCDYVAGLIEMLAADYDAAVDVFRANCELFEEVGLRAALSTRAAYLADALYEQGSHAEAEHWSVVARENTVPGDVSAEFSWRSVLAKVRAQQGSLHEAEMLAREAIVLAEATDALNQRGQVHVCLAEVLRLGGRSDEAMHAFDDALRMFDGKGNIVSAARVHDLRTGLVTV